MTEIEEGNVRRRLRQRDLGGAWRGDPPGGFRGLSVDSREVEAGDLFVAVSGVRADGHDFLAEAARAGAAGAVVERPSAGVDLPQLVVADSRAAVAHLASLFAGDPGAELDTLVGITGTNGKTTTAWLTRRVLAGALPTGGIGTLGATLPDGSLRAEDLTTPGPVRLHRLLRELVDAGAEAAVLELSSHALDQERAAALELDAGVFTTLSREHLEYHADMDDYRRAKLRLAELVRPGGVCVVNADEPGWEGADFGGRRTVRYGLSEGADVRAVDVEGSARETRFRLSVPGSGDRHTVRLALIGEYNVGNAAAAAAVGVASGIAPERVAALLTEAPQVPGRLERLRERPLVIRDYAHTPDAMRRAIEAVRRIAGGRVLVVFGAGGERDRGKRPLMGEVVARLADRSWVTNDNPRGEDPGRIAHDVAEAMPEEAREVVLDRREAIRRAMDAAAPGDVVLLLGKGHETHMVVDGQRIPFDEADVVAEIAEDAGSPGGGGGAGPARDAAAGPARGGGIP